MPEKYFIADTHYGHANSLVFKRACGAPLRSFASVEEMDETMVANHNATVKPGDTVYHLGDVTINRRCLPILSRLNGRKILVRGNHDIWRTEDFLPYFEEIYGVKVFTKEGFICSHIPLHPDSLGRWSFNVHGHLHEKEVKDLKDPELPDFRYLCVSVERINYTPVPMDFILLNKQLAALSGEMKKDVTDFASKKEAM